jgi:hypothetical protein
MIVNNLEKMRLIGCVILLCLLVHVSNGKSRKNGKWDFGHKFDLKKDAPGGEVQVSDLNSFRAFNSSADFEKIIFVKRYTYQSNHYYTDFINGCEFFGGSLCELDLRNGKVRDIAPSLSQGIFGRYDISFDAKKIVFAWKERRGAGFRIYEVNVDGSELKQLTFPETDEDSNIRKYKIQEFYQHHSDDMTPCYLPDGGIAFISTRCKYGILCDTPDLFTTTTLFRMDGNGENITQLSRGSVSEDSPVVMEDGRILYTRWEYLDKGAVSVKCLWAMYPDGSSSNEIYGNTIPYPPTLTWGRQVPGEKNLFVAAGTPHCPQNGVGTIILIDTEKGTRTEEAMDYVTPDIDIREEGGFHFKKRNRWVKDSRGGGPLYTDPYPLSKSSFLVSHKPGNGRLWRDLWSWGLYALNDKGETYTVYDNPNISCFQPMPLKLRKTPPVLYSSSDRRLADKDMAACVVTNVYHGMEGIEKGEAKYIRINEQVPRFWTARRFWKGDNYDQQHAVVSKDASLGLKVQHGIVPVEEDGSAYFVVPANRNIFFQVLDENFMELQRERTIVNYIPGEVRSCIGCHEQNNESVNIQNSGRPMAMRRQPSVPGPQPGEETGQRTISYERDVQPIFDKHCVSCHNGNNKKTSLSLLGNKTKFFSVSYENLMPERRKRQKHDPMLLGPIVGDNHNKTGEGDSYYGGNSVKYCPPKSVGSHTSRLVKLLMDGHNSVELSKEEFIRLVTWIDSNGQYYGSYWGRRNIKYKKHPNFRPDIPFRDAVSNICPIPEDKR